jgi:hypothetical protein
MPVPKITERHPKSSIKSLKGTPADNAPNIPRQSAKPVTTAKWPGLNHRVANFNIETQATPIDAPIIKRGKIAKCSRSYIKIHHKLICHDCGDHPMEKARKVKRYS